jgi:hypothetical protein
MEFTTQRELLEYLGKNQNDRKLIQRMMERGEVYKEDGMYHLIKNKQRLIDEVRELRMKVIELEKKVAVSKERNEDMQEYLKMKEDLKEAKIQWEYYENMYIEEKTDKEYRLRKAFDWIKDRIR